MTFWYQSKSEEPGKPSLRFQLARPLTCGMGKLPFYSEKRGIFAMRPIGFVFMFWYASCSQPVPVAGLEQNTNLADWADQSARCLVSRAIFFRLRFVSPKLLMSDPSRKKKTLKNFSIVVLSSGSKCFKVSCGRLLGN